LPQPYSSSNTSKSTGKKSLLPEIHRSTPNIQELISEIAAGRAELPYSRGNLPPGLVQPPSLSPYSKPRIKLGELFCIENQATELTKIYSFDTRQAMLVIYSTESHVSEDEIQDMLTSYGQIYWGYLMSQDETMHGYYGTYYQGDTPIDISPEQTHTYISILWPRHTKVPLLNRLRMLGQAGCFRLSFWLSLVGAIAATDYAMGEGNLPESAEKVAGMPAMFADLIHAYYYGGGKKPPIQEIQALARFLATPAEKKPGNVDPTELDACGVAFLLKELGKSLWTPSALQSGARMFGFSNELSATYWLYSLCADYWLNLVNIDKIELTVAGMRVCYPGTDSNTIVGLWKQSIECEFWKIPSEALRYLQRYQRFSNTDTPHQVVDGYDATYGDALAQKLITEAQAHTSYASVGAFRTALPTEMPIRHVQELCIW